MLFQSAEHWLHVMQTAHGEQHTDECKYHPIPAVSARLTEGAAERKQNANKEQGAYNLKQCSSSMTVICMRDKQKRKEGKLQSAKRTMNPPLSQVMTEQSSKMSGCVGTCGKTSELNGERGGRKNSQTVLQLCIAFLTFYIKRKS